MVRFFMKYSSASVERMLEELQRKVGGDLRDVKRHIGQIYLSAVEDRIVNKEVGPRGQKWKPITTTTFEQKKYGKFKTDYASQKEVMIRQPSIMKPRKLLVWTGRLVSSLHYRIEGNEIWIGTKGIEYARTIQYGARKGQFKTWQRKPFLMERSEYDMQTRGGRSTHVWVGGGTGYSPWRDIPPRPFLGFDLSTNEKIRRMLAKELGETLKLGPKWARDL